MSNRVKKDKRKVKTMPPMSVIIPFIMKNRNGSCNLMSDKIDIVKPEKYISEKRAEGMKNLTMMHLIIASYCRLVSQKPAINRFIRGQRVYTRRSIEIALTIKKSMTIDSPDTVIKITLDPSATIKEVYESFNTVITEYRENPGGDFDDTAKFLSHIPTLILRSVVGFLRSLDYFGLMPKFIEKVSPFHCSMFITSMGSLGISAIYHHLYDFGTCPVFVAFGAKKRRYEVDSEGNVYKRQYMDIKFTLDERICDGFYYAKAFKYFKGIIDNPWVLDVPPERVVDDID